MIRSSFGLGCAAAVVATVVALGGCSDERRDRNGDGSTTTSSSTGTYTGPPPEADCADKLEPVPHAGQIEVVGDGTPESCTELALQDAVEILNGVDGGGTITFDCGGEHTITLTASLFVDGSLIVDGGGEITISGGGAVRVFELDHYTDFVVQQLTIRDGLAVDSGAGILHPWFGTLKAIDVTFDNNHCTSRDHDIGGGAIFAGGLTEAVLSGCMFSNNSGSTGGGVLSRTTNLTVVDCVFFNNTATSYGESGQYGNGGGLYIDRMYIDDPRDFQLCGTIFDSNHATQHGSAFFSYNREGTRATFDRCTFTNNDMAGSPGGGAGGVYHEGVPLLLTNSTFAGNTTGKHAAGLFLGGGTDAEIVNSTFANHTVPEVGAALFAGNGNVRLTNCTFSANDADYAPAIFKGESGSVTLTNVIMAYNTTPNQYSALSCHETFNDGGGNFQWPATKASGSPDNPCTATVVFADPLLQPLADNGGPTETMALAASSPAIDVAADCPPTDQRGEPRVGLCDSGAYEHQP